MTQPMISVDGWCLKCPLDRGGVGDHLRRLDLERGDDTPEEPPRRGGIPLYRTSSTDLAGRHSSSRSRTDRQVTPPSNFSNSVTGVVTTVSPRSRSSAEVRGASADMITVVGSIATTADPCASGTGRKSANRPGSSTNDAKPITVPSGTAVRPDFRCNALVTGTSTTAQPRGSRRFRSWAIPAALVRLDADIDRAAQLQDIAAI